MTTGRELTVLKTAMMADRGRIVRMIELITQVEVIYATMREIRETLPHVEVVSGMDREIVNDLIRRSDAALATVAR